MPQQLKYAFPGLPPVPPGRLCTPRWPAPLLALPLLLPDTVVAADRAELTGPRDPRRGLQHSCQATVKLHMHSVWFPLQSKGVVRGRRVQQLAFALHTCVSRRIVLTGGVGTVVRVRPPAPTRDDEDLQYV